MLDKIKDIIGIGGNKPQVGGGVGNLVQNKNEDINSLLNNPTQAEIEKLVEEKLEYLEWLIKYSRANNLKLLPSPAGLDTFACGLDEKDEIFANDFVKGKIKFEDIPKHNLKPKLFYYDLKMLLKSDTKTLAALGDHEIEHAVSTDYFDLFWQQKRAKELGLPITRVMKFFNGANEDPYIGRKVSKKSLNKRNMVRYLYEKLQDIDPKGEYNIKQSSKIEQLKTLMMIHWLNNDFKELFENKIIVDEEIQKIFDEEILPNFDKMIAPDIPNLERMIFKNSILFPILEKLGKEDLEKAMQMKKMLENLAKNSGKQEEKQDGGQPQNPGESNGEKSDGKGEQDKNDGKPGEGEGQGKGSEDEQTKSSGNGEQQTENMKQNNSGKNGNEENKTPGNHTGKSGKLENNEGKGEDNDSNSGNSGEKSLEEKLKELQDDPKKMEEALKKAQEEIDNMTDEEKKKLQDETKRQIDKENIDDLKKEIPSLDWDIDENGDLEFKPKEKDPEEEKKSENLEKKIEKAIDEHKKEIEKTKEITDKISKAESQEELDKLSEEIKKLKSKKLKNPLQKQAEDKKENIRQERERKLENMKEQGFGESEEQDYNDFIKLEEQIEPYVDDFIEALADYIPKLKEYTYTGAHYSGVVYDIPKAARKVKMGHYDIYGRKDEIETMKINVGISLSLDVSQSMNGEKIRESLKLMIFLGIFCEKLSIPFYINTIGNSPREIKTVLDSYINKKGDIYRVAKNPNEGTYMKETFEKVQEVIVDAKYYNEQIEFIPMIITDGIPSDSGDELEKIIDKFDGLDVVFGVGLDEDEKETMGNIFKKGKKIHLDDSIQILDRGKEELIDYLVENKDRLFVVEEN